MKSKTYKLSRFLLAALMLLLPLEIGYAANAGTGTLGKIDRALAAGRLSYEESVLYKIYSIRSPEKIPTAYRADSEVPSRCGTMIIREALLGMSTFTPRIQAGITEALARPSRVYNYDSPGGYFKIHYDVSGTHAVPTADDNTNGIPDYVENLALYADSSWEHEVITLGWRQPPSDGGEGGDGRYDIYTESMYYYGYCSWETAGPEPWNDFSSYISVHKDFIGFPPNEDPEGNPVGAAKVTVAHEFNHACQFAYDIFDENFFYELSAVYMEDEVFDVVNDNYNYLGEFFDAPHTSLRENSYHMYSTFIFGSYLTETFDSRIMPEIWEYMRYQTAAVAIDLGLIDRGSSFAEQFPIFTGWNYLTSFRDDGYHYDEGGNYPYLNVNFTENTYPASGSQTSGTRPESWAANYITFNPGTATNKILGIDFNGQNGIPWGFSVVAYSIGVESDVYCAEVDPVTGDGTIYVPFFPDHLYLVGVPTNLNSSLNGANYQYSASLFTPGDVNEDGNMNPVDLVLMVNFVYLSGADLLPDNCFGDCNCDGSVNPVDVVFLVRHVYLAGPVPCTE